MKNENKKKTRIARILLSIMDVLIVVNIVENLSVGVTMYEVDEESLTEESLRIIQLSDIHMIRSNRQSDALYKKVIDLQPDIIAITGDLVDSGKYNNQNYQQSVFFSISFCFRCASCTRKRGIMQKCVKFTFKSFIFCLCKYKMWTLCCWCDTIYEQ